MPRETPAEFADSIQQKNIASIMRLEEAAMAERSRGEHLGRKLVRYAGTPKSVIAHAIVFGGWIVINGPATPAGLHFDPYPFSLLGLIATIEAIFLALFILTTQNRQQREADRREHLNLQVNLLTEREATETLSLLHDVAAHFNLRPATDIALDELKAETNPEALVDTIKNSLPERD